jgi:ribosomal protein S18 acetylase RimI-like enzyme
VEVQRATVANASEILALQKLAYQSEAELYDAYDIPPLTQSLAEMEVDLAQQHVLKLVQAARPGRPRIVGSVRAYEQGGTCHIGRLIVHPEHQNRGLGTRLMREIEAAFPQVERFELFTGHKSERNLYLYSKLGYTEFRREPVDDKLVIVFLEKRQLEGRELEN